MTFDEVLARFPPGKQQGRTWALKCPVHDDRVASLSASTGDDGRVLLHCHAGCAVGDILAAVGLTTADLFDEPRRSALPVPVLRSSSAAAVYDYCDAEGVLLHQVVRGADKSFKQRQPDGQGGWWWSGAGARVPYRLPELVGEETVWVVEGEKDVETCRAHGLVATCNRGGAGKWKEEETAALVAAGVRQVYVVPDHDVPGRRHAQSVVEQLTAAGVTATLVPLPGLQAHGDISDWFASGGTVEALQGLAQRPLEAITDVVSVPEVLRAEQAFSKLGEGRYRLEYPGLGITLEANQLHRDRDRDLHGELTVTTTLVGAKTVDGVLLWSSMNFSSQRTRATIASSLAGRSGAAQLDWVGAVETLSLRMSRAEAEGSPIQPLADYPKPVAADSWEVSGLPILQRHPMILFGDGGSAKSYLALHIAATLASRGIKVLYADWEFSPEDHRERLERLTGEALMPRDNLQYVRCAGPLVSEVARLQAHIAAFGTQYIVCDSIAFAVPGRPEDAENASAYYRAVRYMGIGSLHLAHTTKSVEHGEDKPFGSVFWSNGARSMWFVKRGEGSEPHLVEVSLTHKKSNTGRRLPAVGLRFRFDLDRTHVERFDVADSAELSATLPLWQRIKSLVGSRSMTIEQISEELDSKPDSVRKVVLRMDLFQRAADGHIRLATALHTSEGKF